MMNRDDDFTFLFSSIEWCNMGLLSLRTERLGETDDFVIEIVDLYADARARSEVRFKDATYVSLNVDFASKRSCSDALYGADCRLESGWKKSLADAHPYDNFDAYFHFQIGLVPHGGSIDLLALAFEIHPLETEQLTSM